MPAKRELTMRQLRYMLRLHHDGVSAREIGRTLGVARSTIQDNLRRAQASGIAWPVPAELTDDILEQRLFARGGTKAGLRRRSEPDWGTLARELKRAGVNHGCTLFRSSAESCRRMRFFARSWDCTCPASVAPSGGAEIAAWILDAPNSACCGDLAHELTIIFVFFNDVGTRSSWRLCRRTYLVEFRRQRARRQRSQSQGARRL
jgi:hypothetical protein